MRCGREHLHGKVADRLHFLQKFLGSKWPEPLGDDWQDLSLSLQERTHDVALKILQCFAIALGRGEHYFDEVITLF